MHDFFDEKKKELRNGNISVIMVQIANTIIWYVKLIAGMAIS